MFHAHSVIDIKVEYSKFKKVCVHVSKVRSKKERNEKKPGKN